MTNTNTQACVSVAQPNQKNDPSAPDVRLLQEQAAAWFLVADTLTEVAEWWHDLDGSGMDKAAKAIRQLAAPAQQADPTKLSAAERLADMRHYLNEAHQFAAMSPRGRDCIGIVLDQLDEMEAEGAAAAAKPPAQGVGDERAAFEAWRKSITGLKPHAWREVTEVPVEPSLLDRYITGIEQQRWEAWQARAALAQAPAGMATVPVTPTDDMLIAGQEAWMCTNAHRPAVEDCEQATAVWAAMVAAT